MKYSTAAAAALFALSSSVALAQTAPPSTGAGAAPSDSGAAAQSDGTSKQTAPANKTDGSSSGNMGASSGASSGTSGTDPSMTKDKTPPVNGKAAEPNSQTDKAK